MVKINASRDISAQLDRVWQIVADVDNDPKYYKGLNSVKNISNDDNIIEREVVVGFLHHKGRQKVILNPKKSVEVKMTSGPLIGTRLTTLTPSGDHKTRVDVAWDFEFSKVPVFVQSMVKREVEQGTIEALSKIAYHAERLYAQHSTKTVQKSDAV